MAAGHGGARPRAGRPPESKDKIKSSRIVVEATKEKYAHVFADDVNNLSPLEVMLFGMKAAFAAGDIDEAVKHASIAAPYVHSKMPIQSDIRVTTDATETLTLEQVEYLLSVTEVKALPSAEGTDDGPTH